MEKFENVTTAIQAAYVADDSLALMTIAFSVLHHSTEEAALAYINESITIAKKGVFA